MKKFTKALIAIVILLIIAVIVYFATRPKTILNDGYVNGNTPGNLYNGGLFCEDNGVIFFANPKDGYRLYSMDVNGQNLKKLSNDVANYINADDHYVYYVRNNIGKDANDFFSFYRNALCRVPRNGGNVIILDQDPCTYATLIGNYIYYIHYDKESASTLYKIKIDGTDRKQVREDAVYTCSAEGQYFYYTTIGKNGNIYRYDTSTDNAYLLYSGSCYKPIVRNNGSEWFFIDGTNKNSLVHGTTDNGTITTLVNKSVDQYNVLDDIICYQENSKDKSGICIIKTDGSGYQFIKEGIFKDIHITSDYIFFADYHSGDTYYVLRNDPTNVIKFAPAKKK